MEKKLDPQDNKLQISNKKPPRHYQFLSKIFLKKFGQIEMHALGEAISVAVVAAELLQRNELATITSLQQFTFLPEEEKEQQTAPSEENRRRKKVKMIIKMEKTKEFDSKVGNLK